LKVALRADNTAQGYDLPDIPRVLVDAVDLDPVPGFQQNILRFVPCQERGEVEGDDGTFDHIFRDPDNLGPLHIGLGKELSLDDHLTKLKVGPPLETAGMLRGADQVHGLPHLIIDRTDDDRVHVPKSFRELFPLFLGGLRLFAVEPEVQNYLLLVVGITDKLQPAAERYRHQAARGLNEIADRLLPLQLVNGRPVHGPCHARDRPDERHEHRILVLQPDVLAPVPFQQELVKVYRLDDLART